MPDPSLLEDEAVVGIVTALKRTSNGLWSDLGPDGYILSEKGGQILVCKRGEEQRIKEFSEADKRTVPNSYIGESIWEAAIIT